MFNLFKGSEEPVLRRYIEVIGVTQVKAGRDLKTADGYIRMEVLVDTPPETVVLYTVDDVLATKRFDGTWTLAQVKSWKADKELL